MPEKFDKKQLHAAILDALSTLVENAKRAMLVAYETATHEENIAENKYHTLGLEAAYLAQGQARRLAECEADLLAFQNSVPRDFTADDAIALGALVQLQDEDHHRQFLFLGPAAGGLKVVLDGTDIMVITAAAPLGQALLNAGVGDQVSVRLAARPKHYEVLALF